MHSLIWHPTVDHGDVFNSGLMPVTYPSLPLSPRHEAQRLEQEARGRLERQKILDQSEAEKARRELLELEAQRLVWKYWQMPTGFKEAQMA